MKIYKFYGENVEGGQHNSFFVVISDSKKNAEKIIKAMLKDEIIDKEELNDFELEFKSESEIIEGIVHWDDGDCC